MKKRDRRPEETGGQWIDTLCDLLKGGALAGLAAILALLLCAVLVSAGLLGDRGMEGSVLAVCVLGGMIGGNEAHPDSQWGHSEGQRRQGRLRRVPDFLPVCLQDFLHRCQPEVREPVI